MPNYEIAFGIRHTIKVEANDTDHARLLYDQYQEKNSGWYRYPVQIINVDSPQLALPLPEPKQKPPLERLVA